MDDFEFRKHNNPPFCVFCRSAEHYTVDHPREPKVEAATTILTDADTEIIELVEVSLPVTSWIAILAELEHLQHRGTAYSKAYETINQALFEDGLEPAQDLDSVVDPNTDWP